MAHVEHILVRHALEGWWRQWVFDPADQLLDGGAWKKNLVVAKAGDLLSWFLKEGGLVGGPLGIQYYALGSGLASWDSAPVQPSPSDVKLQTEIAASRKVPSLTFLDANNNPTATKTDKIELQVTYGTTELNGTTWREFGVFAGDATTSVDTGYLLNHVIHGAFPKTSAITVTRKTRFQF